jgi:hypothetical protein
MNRLSGVTRVAGDTPVKYNQFQRYFWDERDGRKADNGIQHGDGGNEATYDGDDRSWKQAVHSRIFWASLAAVVLNVATVGSAFWMDFLNPSVGIGCRSGAILIYWITSYFVWGTLVLSAWLSDLWSVRVAREIHVKGRHLRRNSFTTFSSTRLIALAAVTSRILGKTLAILNAVWIVMTSLFEFTGFYTRCWCQTVRGTSVLLFLDPSTIRDLENVKERWLGLAMLTGFVCVFYITFIGFWTARRL